MIGNLLRKRAARGDLTVDGRVIRLDPSRLLGEGGEAEVYDVGGGIALKRFKPPGHADFAHAPDAQRAAAERLTVHQQKLPALLSLELPPGVVAPLAAALDDEGAIAGYTMPIVRGAEPLMRYGDPAFRKAASMTHEDVVAILMSLHATVVELHRRGIVIGDFNDLNVLVRGRATQLIDVDSVQFGPFPSTLFTARFLDPLLTDGKTLRPARAADENSDWFAFAIFAFQLLLYVHPYGGVHRPAGEPAFQHDARMLQRISVFDGAVRYPRHARPLRELPDALRAWFREVFERELRGPFPLGLLDAHSAPIAAPLPVPPRTMRGRVIAEVVETGDVPRPQVPRFRIEGDTLYREGALGSEVVGSVLAGQTRIWAGPSFGFGFYRAGELTVAFVFDAWRRGIRDDVRLPRIAGQIVDADAVFGADRCWFFLATQENGRLLHRCVVIGRDGALQATLVVEPAADHWLSQIRGHAAAGESLLVATDDGVVRVGVEEGVPRVTATFPETKEFVNAHSTLFAAADGLYATDGERVLRLRFV